MPLLACVGRRGNWTLQRGRARIYKRITYAQCPPVESAEVQPVTKRFLVFLAGFSGGLVLRRDSIVCLHYITTCTIWHAFFPGGCSLAPGSALSSLAASHGLKV